MLIRYKKLGFVLICFFTWCTYVEAQDPGQSVREQIHLDGSWRFVLDPTNTGLKHNWQDSTLTEAVNLPGSLEENGKGNPVKKASGNFLNQTFQYVGAAWYQKEIHVPASWNDKQVELFLERTKVAQVWIDNQLIGHSTLLSAPQVYDLTGKLTPGRHVLTIMVNNSPALVSVGGSHALSEHTQTNWNGIIGRMYLEASERFRIDWIKVTPDVKNKLANVQLKVSNLNNSSKKIGIELEASARNSATKHIVTPLRFKVKLQTGDSVFRFSYPLGKEALLWDEYNPSLYSLTVSLIDKKTIIDNASTSFGLREFKASGTQFTINEVITFLRGKNDGCIFPLTGYPPMETAAWQKLYRIAKSYGINHYRFHSYTPQEAAFEAADLEGIYIQSELPNWANFTVKDTFHTAFQYKEGLAILDTYGNHPSFVMFSLGNELGGDSTIHNKLVKDFRKHDSRRLYARGTNAFYADPKPGEADDFWVTMRTGKESQQREFDARGSFATTEDIGNGILNSWEPSTRYNFSSAIKGFKLPVIGHEVGQFQIYPDYTEIPRYTGILRPVNFEIFKQRLENAGMGNQAEDFFKASGKLTALLYREEIEMALRTQGFAGFQLLDLQDYPGQGTALVGLLNAFMENKGIISAEEFCRFNNDVVIQLLMDKYTWTNDQIYSADIQLVNYSPQNIIDKELTWIIEADESEQIATGNLPVRLAGKGKINPLGKITFPLQNISKATKLLIKLEITGTSYKSEYPIWVYPQNVDLKPQADVKVVTKLDQNTIEELNRGGKVLFFPEHADVKDKSVGGQFISEFWNWLVFKGAAKNMNRPESAGTLGILTNPEHPIFNDFPTEFYTNWQWWFITKNARPFILDKTDPTYRPIVQVIDNIDRNHKLGMVFEFKTGKGKLLVSMVNLPELTDKPEARQLYHSILRYMESAGFNPQTPLSLTNLKELFQR